jgi:hypothetical protein
MFQVIEQATMLGLRPAAAALNVSSWPEADIDMAGTVLPIGATSRRQQ